MTYNPHNFNVLFVKSLNEIARFLHQQTTFKLNFHAFQQPQQSATLISGTQWPTTSSYIRNFFQIFSCAHSVSDRARRPKIAGMVNMHTISNTPEYRKVTNRPADSSA